MAEFNCLVGCGGATQGFGSPSPFNTQLSQSETAFEEINTPFARVSFLQATTGRRLITIGNESVQIQQGDGQISFSPPHTAALLSLEVGVGEGFECNFEIIDEEGGDFTRFFKKMVSCNKDTSLSDILVDAEFGWIINSESGSKIITNLVPMNGSIPAKFRALIKTIDVSYDSGKPKYKITATDVMAVTGFDTRIRKTFKTNLQNALIELMRTCDPKIENVKFLRDDTPTGFSGATAGAAAGNLGGGILSGAGIGANAGNNTGGATPSWYVAGKTEFVFENDIDADGNPIEREWHANNNSKIECARTWLNQAKTNNGKGVVIESNPTEEGPSIVFREIDANKDSNQIIGTFIVNGGKCSNVISFSPTINLTTVFLYKQIGGSSGGTSSAKVQNIQPESEETTGCDEFGGISTSNPVPNEKAYKEGDKAPENTAEAQRVSEEASRVLGASPIEAELTIIGTPLYTYIGQSFFRAKYLSIIYINPFRIGNANNDQDPIWLVEPTCNPVFTSNKWIVKSINHSVRSGSYTTTFKISLPVVINNDTSVSNQSFCISNSTPVGSQQSSN